MCQTQKRQEELKNGFLMKVKSRKREREGDN